MARIILAGSAAAVAGTFVPSIAVPQSYDDASRAIVIEGLCSAGNTRLTAACDTYLRGMYEGLMAGQLSANDVTSFCPPEDLIGTADIRRAFLSYMQDDPDSGSDEAGMVLLSALEDAYPCPVEESPSFPGPMDLLDGTA